MTQSNPYANSVNNDHGFIGTGTPYFYPDDGSNPFFFGNPVSCKITSGAEEKVRTSHRKEDPGAALDSRSMPKPAEVSITTDTFQPHTWAMALMGEAGKQTIEPKTVADEQAKAVFDGYHQLENTNIDVDTLVVNKDGSPLDKSAYSIKAEMGLLQITDEMVATAGDDLTVNYTTEKVTKTVITGAKVTSFKGKIIIDGQNDVTKKAAKLIIPNISLAVGGDFDWFSDDFNKIEMKGTAAVGKKGEAPYTVELID